MSKRTTIKTNRFKQIAHYLSKRFKTILELAAVLTAIASLILSLYANKTAADSLFYNRMTQATVYTYDLQVNPNETQAFSGYSLPTVTCGITFDTGWATALSIINSESGIESMHDYNTKAGISVLNDVTIEFELPFTTVLEYEDRVYQYIFLYIEGADRTWALDCLVFQYAISTGAGYASVLNTLDLLRLEYETNEALRQILTEYQHVCDKIAALPS